MERRESEILLEVGDGAGSRFVDGKVPDEIWNSDRGTIPEAGPMNRVLLGFIPGRGEKRWETVRLPSSLLFLASPLHHAGFQVDVRALPEQGSDARAVEQADWVGLTLYEDNFDGVQEYLSRMPPGFRGLVALGGPMVTLAPWPSVFHLPQANLWIRGEVEAVLPRLLLALNQGDVQALLRERGFIFHFPGLLIISDFGHVHRPGVDELAALPFSLEFVRADHLQAGLEITFSRGCRRGCLFCCRVHGRPHRRLPLEKVERMLSEFACRRRELGLDSLESGTININDDDILQDSEYAASVLQLLPGAGLRLWGVQTALGSLVSRGGKINRPLIRTLADPTIYAGGRPLLWIGSDVFLAVRARRLGKVFPPRASLRRLFDLFEREGVRHFHYWISSDAKTSWPEFLRELLAIVAFAAAYPSFDLLPHAPFLVPYAGAPILSRLYLEGRQGQIVFRRHLAAPVALFSHSLVARVETGWENLNRLLKNEKIESGTGREGFFDALRRGDHRAALAVAYHFLRQERLQADSAGASRSLRGLRECEVMLEEKLARGNFRPGRQPG